MVRQTGPDRSETAFWASFRYGSRISASITPFIRDGRSLPLARLRPVSPAIRAVGPGAEALPLQRPQVLTAKRIEALLLPGIHGYTPD